MQGCLYGLGRLSKTLNSDRKGHHAKIMNPKNTRVSIRAYGDWRVPPADRTNSEVRTYRLSPEELEKYRKGGEKKVEEAKNCQAEKERSLKQILEEDFATGKKTLNEIAEELGMKPWLVKAAAVRMGYIGKKEKPATEMPPTSSQTSSDIILRQAEFAGRFKYAFRDGKLTIRQDKRRSIILSLNEIDSFRRDLSAVIKQINVLNILQEAPERGTKDDVKVS